MSSRAIVAVAVMVGFWAGIAQAQDIIFSEQFELYTAGNLLSEEAPSLWAIDLCRDAKIDYNVNYSKTAVDYKINPDLRVGVRDRHDLTATEMALASVVHGGTPTCVNGTDANPLGLQFMMHLGPTSDNVYYYKLNLYAELSCGSDRAPTPMLPVVDCSPPYGKYRYSMNLDGDGQRHRSIAVGQIAWADQNPCDIIDEQVAQNYRLTIYDGRQWKILNSPVDMHTCGAWNTITLEINTSTIVVTLKSRFHPDTGDCATGLNTFTTTIDREYLGPFTAVKFGNLPREEVEGGGCWGEDNAPGAYPNQGTNFDNLYVYNGEAFDTQYPCQVTGACCYEDGHCVDGILENACPGPANRFTANKTCGEIKCCQYPFADGDKDHDVDQMDFAAFQLCYLVTPLPDNCKCWDRYPLLNPDGQVNADDFAEFQSCWTGPNVPFNPSTPPTGCHP